MSLIDELIVLANQEALTVIRKQAQLMEQQRNDLIHEMARMLMFELAPCPFCGGQATNELSGTNPCADHLPTCRVTQLWESLQSDNPPQHAATEEQNDHRTMEPL